MLQFDSKMWSLEVPILRSLCWDVRYPRSQTKQATSQDAKHISNSVSHWRFFGVGQNFPQVDGKLTYNTLEN